LITGQEKKNKMKTNEVMEAWKSVLSGRRPSLAH
jgi:hypothetical protein